METQTHESTHPYHIPARLRGPYSPDRKQSFMYGFSWHGQLAFDGRVALVKDYLGRVYRKDVAVEVVRYDGPVTDVPLTLTQNPLEALIYTRTPSTAEGYAQLVRAHLAGQQGSRVYKPSPWLAERLENKGVCMGIIGIASWAELPICPRGGEAITLWELPACLDTQFYADQGDGLRQGSALWNLSPYIASLLLDDRHRPQAEFISLLTTLSGEPNLLEQLNNGTAPNMWLPAAEVYTDHRNKPYIPHTSADEEHDLYIKISPCDVVSERLTVASYLPPG